MKLIDLVNELEVDSPAANVVSPLRLLTIGKYLGLKSGQSVIDFGCGRGEMLCLWTRDFGTIGVGVDTDSSFLEDAAKRAGRWDITDKVEFICQDMNEYELDESVFDVAACMGATMGFGGFEPTIHHLKSAIVPRGSIVIAEPFYSAKDVSNELREYEGDYHLETELFDIVRKEGLEVGYYARATQDEWYRYIFSSRKNEMQEFLEVPAGQTREERRLRLHRWQDMYLRYRQKWQEMAFLTLHPA